MEWENRLFCLFDDDDDAAANVVVWLYSVLFSVNGKVRIESCLVIKLAHMDFGHAEECAAKRKTIRNFLGENWENSSFFPLSHSRSRFYFLLLSHSAEGKEMN